MNKKNAIQSVTPDNVREQVIERLQGYYGDDVRSLIIHDHINEYNDKHYLYVYPVSYGDNLGLADLDQYSYLIVCNGEVIKDTNGFFGVGHIF